MEYEHQQKINKLHSDFENKLVTERKKLEFEVSEKLLEKVIKKTSMVISSNPEKKQNALRKLFQ